MDAQEWEERCAYRLHRHWPSVERDDLLHVAESLRAEARWSAMEPAEAAVQWLSQGIPAVLETRRVGSR